MLQNLLIFWTGGVLGFAVSLYFLGMVGRIKIVVEPSP